MLLRRLVLPPAAELATSVLENYGLCFAIALFLKIALAPVKGVHSLVEGIPEASDPSLYPEGF